MAAGAATAAVSADRVRHPPGGGRGRAQPRHGAVVGFLAGLWSFRVKGG
ncbi:MAG TPA: hypothetical protein VNV66_17415 [Pilimelia sp.]|nr:hypothetical protein [Pilimelia sp.]